MRIITTIINRFLRWVTLRTKKRTLMRNMMTIMIILTMRNMVRKRMGIMTRVMFILSTFLKIYHTNWTNMTPVTKIEYILLQIYWEILFVLAISTLFMFPLIIMIKYGTIVWMLWSRHGRNIKFTHTKI